MDYNTILDQVGYPPEYSREKAIEAMKLATQPQPAQQDLRERADECWSKYLNRTGYAPSVYVDGFIGGVTYASDVSAEKDKEIELLKINYAALKYLAHEKTERIAELEKQLQDFHNLLANMRH